MKTNMLEAVVLLRIARDKLEEEENLIPFDEAEKRDRLSDAADDIGNILVALGDTAADAIASSILVALDMEDGT